MFSLLLLLCCQAPEQWRPDRPYGPWEPNYGVVKQRLHHGEHVRINGYEWVKIAGYSQWALVKEREYVGVWNADQQKYWPHLGPDQWGQECKPPIEPPAEAPHEAAPDERPAKSTADWILAGMCFWAGVFVGFFLRGLVKR